MTREDAGPFLILGIDKDADAASIESQYQLRLGMSQRSEIKWTDGDLAWAREQLLDRDLRTAADANSLNADLASGDVRRLSRLYRIDSVVPAWEPMDPEPPAELPEANIDLAALVADMPTPTVPLELPAITRWLDRCAAIGLDPWAADVLGT
jgi:hypothetical protein